MDMLETYSLLFADSLMEILVLPPHTAYVLKTMLGFGGYAPGLMFACVSAGVLLGVLLNWSLGRLLVTCRDKEWVIVETPQLDKAAAFFRKFLSWLVVLAWVPGLGGIIMVAAGLSKVRFLLVLALAGVGIAGYYSFIILGVSAFLL